MKISRFEEILVWQKTKPFIVEIYKSFLNVGDYSFRDQVLRASVSIMNNIAEGFERGSNPDFKKFLYISKGSAGEVRSMLYLALDLSYITQEKSAKLIQETEEISKMLSGLIKVL
ncbi:four helix bundle protein [Candidatus Shapirobacteria bacterium]|nr:four helix bundle protein [Candidatus Shapirobacteria bacterium]